MYNARLGGKDPTARTALSAKESPLRWALFLCAIGKPVRQNEKSPPKWALIVGLRGKRAFLRVLH